MKNTTRITETATITDRINALESIMATTDDSFFITIDTILNEYRDRLEYLNKSKEYMVHFKGGGWNTVYGVDEESAFSAAQLEFEEPGKTTCIVQSVSIATKSGIEAAMRLFY
jgi:hypothetical protein